MDAPLGIRAYLPWFAAIGLLVTFGMAFAFVSVDLSTLNWLKGVRQADGLVEGPAIYRGTLAGPADRVDPTGAPAALFRAWVESTEEDNHDTFCVTHAYDRASIVTEHGTFPLAWLDGDRDIPVMGDDDDPPANVAVIDLDEVEPAEPEGFSGPLAPCGGASRRSRVHAIRAGTKVEVLACAKDGALGPCSGVLENVLATRGLGAHRARRADSVTTTFRVASIIALALLIVVGFWVSVHRAKVFAQLRPEARR